MFFARPQATRIPLQSGSYLVHPVDPYYESAAMLSPFPSISNIWAMALAVLVVGYLAVEGAKAKYQKPKNQWTKRSQLFLSVDPNEVSEDSKEEEEKQESLNEPKVQDDTKTDNDHETINEPDDTTTTKGEDNDNDDGEKTGSEISNASSDTLIANYAVACAQKALSSSYRSSSWRTGQEFQRPSTPTSSVAVSRQRIKPNAAAERKRLEALKDLATAIEELQGGSLRVRLFGQKKRLAVLEGAFAVVVAHIQGLEEEWEAAYAGIKEAVARNKEVMAAKCKEMIKEGCGEEVEKAARKVEKAVKEVEALRAERDELAERVSVAERDNKAALDLAVYFSHAQNQLEWRNLELTAEKMQLEDILKAMRASSEPSSSSSAGSSWSVGWN